MISSYRTGENGRKQAETGAKETSVSTGKSPMNSAEVSKIHSYRFSVAPMMEWTDRHCRFFHRLLTRRALIYTEMITTGAVLHGARARLLAHDPAEHPVALQLGG